jgi:penicillin-binding protein 1A
MISRTVRRRIKKCLLWMEVLLILVLGAGVGVVAGAFYQISKVLPPQSYVSQYKTPAGTTIWSCDNVLLARLATENREPVPFERIPLVMQQAMVDIEDARFYQHSGLDFRGLLRALWVNLRGGDLTQQGGSTITQQLARNIYLTPTRTISRKIKETLLAVQIERNWTKKQILETYLNQVYFGSQAYGVQSAARIYFNKDVKDLTLGEAATLAGLPQRPSQLSPYVALERTGKLDITINRRNQVLQRMADLGHITKEQAETAMREPLKLAHKKAPQLGGYYKARHFVDYVVRNLRETYGDDMLFKGGLSVVTTLNYRMQRDAERAARAGVRKYGQNYHLSECGLVAIEPQTGFIRAMVGGVQEPWERFQFNCAEQAHRSPGSAFKAFVYATALEEGWTPSRTISTAVKPIKDGSKYWVPKNHGHSGGGSMTLLSAFANSVNTAAINLNMQVGPQNVVSMAHRLGIKSKLLAVPSLALGTSEVTVLEMANAYSVFANKGTRADPQPILKIANQDGAPIESNAPKITRDIVSEEVVEGMNVMMRAVVTSGTGRAAGVVPNAKGKTGTGEEHRDAWFVGFTPELCTAVWVGNRDNSPMRHIFGGQISAPIWADFMQGAMKVYEKEHGKPEPAEEKSKGPDRAGARTRAARDEDPDRDFEPVPVIGAGSRDNLLRVKMCVDSNELATRFCPNVETRLYLSGQQPSRRCTMHKPPAEPAPTRVRRPPGSRDTQGASADGSQPESPRRRRRVRTRRAPPDQIPDANTVPDDGATTPPERPRRAPRRSRSHRPPATTPDSPPTDTRDQNGQ